jgi:hypothetical protein
MTENEVERLEREITERQARLAEINPTLTREQLEGMTPRQIADLDPAVVNRALEATT